MRAVSSAEAGRNFSAIREEVVAAGAEPIAVTLDNIRQVVVISYKEYGVLVRKARFAGRTADLPEEDLVALASLDRRNTRP